MTPIRVLIAKPGLDGHDVGAKLVCRALRDAGMEVLYSGLRRSPEAIAATARDEDVHVVGLSILSGAHNTLVPRVIDLLAERGADDVVVFVGGIIPDEDFERLQAKGVKGIFTPGTTTSEIVDFVKREIEGAESAA